MFSLFLPIYNNHTKGWVLRRIWKWRDSSLIKAHAHSSRIGDVIMNLRIYLVPFGFPWSYRTQWVIINAAEKERERQKRESYISCVDSIHHLVSGVSLKENKISSKKELFSSFIFILSISILMTVPVKQSKQYLRDEGIRHHAEKRKKWKVSLSCWHRQSEYSISWNSLQGAKYSDWISKFLFSNMIETAISSSFSTLNR